MELTPIRIHQLQKMSIKNILLLVLLWSPATLVAQKTNKIEKAVIQISINCDHCKMCETCGKMFESELYNRIKGLKRFDLNENDKTLIVYYNTKRTNLGDIKTAISKLGYDADEVKAVPEAYQKLDGCCRK